MEAAKALARFSPAEVHLRSLSESYELDDLMLEWRHGTDMSPFMKPPTQSIFATTLSALEKALAHMKGDFCTAHAVLRQAPKSSGPLALPMSVWRPYPRMRALVPRA